MKDLVVLVADKNMQTAIEALLQHRRESMGTVQISFDIFRHPEHDPGCYRRSSAIVEGLHPDYRYLLIVFDFEGSGADEPDADAAADCVLAGYELTPWAGRVAVVAINPELEAWVWCPSPHVEAALGWNGRNPNLRSALQQAGWWPENAPRPLQPKESFEWALERAGVPRSPAILARLARSVSLANCGDPQFVRFRSALQTWFGETLIDAGTLREAGAP